MKCLAYSFRKAVLSVVQEGNRRDCTGPEHSMHVLGMCLQVEMHALKTVSAPLAALIYTAEPLWGALFAWVLLKERWGPTGWVGAALIVSSTAASQLVNSRSKPKKE